MLCNHSNKILTNENVQIIPLSSSVCAHHLMYIMYLFSGLLEDLCGLVLNQKSNLYMVKFVHLGHLFLLLLLYIMLYTLKIFCLTLVSITAMVVPSHFLYLFLLSVSFFFGLQRKWKL